MKGLFWLLVVGFVMTAAGIVWHTLRKSAQRRLAALKKKLVKD